MRRPYVEYVDGEALSIEVSRWPCTRIQRCALLNSVIYLICTRIRTLAARMWVSMVTLFDCNFV